MGADRLRLEADALGTFSLAAHQNSHPLLRRLRVSHPRPADGDAPAGPAACDGLEVRLACDPVAVGARSLRLVEDRAWPLSGTIRPGQSVDIDPGELRIDAGLLAGLTEAVETTLRLTLSAAAEPGAGAPPAAAVERRVSVLPHDHWGGESRQPELLAAFVRPNEAHTESLVRQAAAALGDAGHGSQVDGYQSRTRERPYLMGAALWNAVWGQRIAYVAPPPGFAESGQKVLGPAEIGERRMGACLDTSLLFAGCLERMGLNPVVAMTRGHAFAGFWLVDACFPVLTCDDPMDLRKRMDLRDLALFETTLATADSPVTFEEAQERARQLVAEENEDEFVHLVDIRQARRRQVRPLAAHEERPRAAETKPADASGGALSLPEPPPLPRVGPDDAPPANETPETRVDTWERKLLDLTKRNRFLNLSERAASVPVHCPDIGALEDALAQDREFTFVSAEESPVRDPGGGEGFRLAAGNDLHRQYALEQLAGGVLVANQGKKRLEGSTLELLRKAKGDLEEGGANTLFLAMGMLRWKDNPDDKRSYRAPLILFPVRLSRKSARAPIRLGQLPDEDPVFNPTLLEFLRQWHEIGLPGLAEELPQDDHGVDVAQVWDRVRHAIAEHAGFEVVEELVLASFSFAKHLMWKDLRDRVDTLKSSPFVRHMIDSPGERYRQETSFIESREVDDKVDPREVFTPLNCDSSQLAAVEASGHAQDFVLEGPPGTGKSETIANIVCHNIALGRKVLFVAEKMAALSVVHQRLVKVGLGHLCLELHSSKANKKAVLAQLRAAWDARGKAARSDWTEDARRQRELRDRLNQYVKELHQASPLGLTPHDVIARLSLRGKEHRLDLGWEGGIGDAPVGDEAGVRKMLGAATRLAAAHAEIADLDPGDFAGLGRRDWSNAWQESFVRRLGAVRDAAGSLRAAAEAFAAAMGLEVRIAGPKSAGHVARLAEVVGLARAHRLGYALADGAADDLERLGRLAEHKRSLDRLVAEVGSRLTAENIALLPAEEWAAAKAEAVAKGIWGVFRRWRLRKAPAAFGLGEIADLSHFDRIAEARGHHRKIEEIRPAFEADRIWEGWGTLPGDIEAAAERGRTVLAALAPLAGISGNPAKVRAAVRDLLVGQRDFLNESSPIVEAQARLGKAWGDWTAALGAAADEGLEHPEDSTFGEVAQACGLLLDNERKLKRWCDWLAQADAARTLGLGRLAEALLKGEIPPGDAKEEATTALCRWLAPRLIDGSEVLRQFSSSGHQAMIDQYREIARHVAETTGGHIAALSAAATPDPSGPDAPPEYDILARELAKKGRHKPVRTLVREMGARLTDLVPCLMMSPLSVAQFLPADFGGFDLVIFDEASQITPWDAIGAIARGKNTIVVGDPKQMPPTNFFSGGAAGEEDADEDDVESILDQALNARLPHLRLTGHYRSRHESLIAFSNSHYYENSLTTFPSAETRESAVGFVRVPDGLYSKGKGRNNPNEARAVADEVVRRLRDPRDRKMSIGVVTLNTEQQRAIEDLLEEARRKHPEIEEHFQDTDRNDHVFVKNLESVQGDERDVIIISLGYGPTEPGAKTMSMNFGPMNKAGGERRLNVAITRARHDVLVFASFDHTMVDLSRTRAVAVEHLKNYVRFAEEGPSSLASVARAEHGVDQFDSPFEQGVATALRARGWKAQTQVGVGKFRIDLGIVHPDMPGEYLAGVECDGYTYHSSPSARDRDRIRHVILEGLGWKLIRLWSIDYFNDSEGAIDRVDRELNALLEAFREQAQGPIVETQAPAPGA